MAKKKKSASFFTKIKKNSSKRTNQLVAFIRNNSGIVAGILLFVLFASLISVRIFENEETVETPPEPTPLEVNTLSFGSVQLSERAVGTVKNLESVTLVAQSSGPVQDILVTEGDSVYFGEKLIQQATAYASGNTQDYQVSVAAKNAEIAQETLENTVETVTKQREQADLVKENADELRSISEKAVDDTKAIITLAETQVEYLENAIDATNSASTQSSLRASLLSARSTLNSSRSQLRNLEYEVDTDNPPEDLDQIAKDLVYKSTELQLETSKLQKEIADLNYKIAQITANTTRVLAPFAGTVEKVYVQEGEYVSPGTPVAVIQGGETWCIQVPVSGKLAQQIDKTGQLTVKTGDQEIMIPINHVTRAPVNGQLFEVLAVIPEESRVGSLVLEDQSYEVELPLLSVSLSEGNSFIPLDAVFVTNTERFVYVVEDGVASKQTVTTGEIIGTSIEITDGLSQDDQVILDRRVVAEQPVTVALNE